MLDKERRKVLENIIKDRELRRPESPRIFSEEEIDLKVNTELRGERGDIFLNPILPIDGQKSSSAEYNSNVEGVARDIEVLYEAIQSEQLDIKNQFESNQVENNNAIRELRKINDEVDAISANLPTKNSITYTVFDSFNDVSKVDLFRTNTNIDTRDGNVSLKSGTDFSLDFNHLRARTSADFNITSNTAGILSQGPTPSSRFGAIFNDEDSDQWVYIVKTTEPIAVEGYFVIQLNRNGTEESINEFIIDYTSSYGLKNDRDERSGFIKVEFRNNITDKFIPIQGGRRTITGKSTVLKFKPTNATHLRITIGKDTPDDFVNLEYRFGIKSIKVKRSTTNLSSTLISKSLPVVSYSNEDVNVFQLTLQTQERHEEGTYIDYYLGIDEPISGKFIDEFNNPVSFDSPNIVSFVPNASDVLTGQPETFFTYASRLRERSADVSGAESWNTWEPTWQRVTPVNSEQEHVPKVLFFNTRTIQTDNHDISFNTDILWGDLSYLGPWPTDGGAFYDEEPAPVGSGVDITPVSDGFGFIWGENIFTQAGIVWGQTKFTPGWFRHKVPDISGNLFPADLEELPPNAPAFPDFFARNTEFFRIFRWPNGVPPIPGSVQLFTSSKVSNPSGSINTHWVWNYKDSNTIETRIENNIRPTGLADVLFTDEKVEEIDPDWQKDSAGKFVNFKNYIPVEASGNRAIIIPDSVKNVRYSNSSDNLVSNVDYRVRYGVNLATNDPDLTKDQNIKDDNLNAFTIDLSPIKFDERQRRENVPDNKFSFQYQVSIVDEFLSTWNTFLYVPPTSDKSSFIKIKTTVDPLNVNSPDVKKIEIIKIGQKNEIVQRIIRDNFDSPIPLELPGWYKVSVFVRAETDPLAVDTDSNNIYQQPKWNPIGSDHFEISPDINLYNSPLHMDVVDMYTLLWDTHTSDNTRTALVEDIDKTTFLTVQIPSKDKFPGYDKQGRFYGTPGFDFKTGTVPVRNASHITRRILIQPTGVGETSTWEQFTTGSSGFLNSNGDIETFVFDSLQKANFGNVSGIILPKERWNTRSGIFYPNLTTFTDITMGVKSSGIFSNVDGSQIGVSGIVNNFLNIHDPCSSGFLFYETAENLESYYSIKYQLPTKSNYNRVFIRADLYSTASGTTPVLESYKIVVNDRRFDFDVLDEEKRNPFERNV